MGNVFVNLKCINSNIFLYRRVLAVWVDTSVNSIYSAYSISINCWKYFTLDSHNRKAAVDLLFRLNASKNERSLSHANTFKDLNNQCAFVNNHSALHWIASPI